MTENNYKEHVYALIYCGGGGTRLWPYSREKAPKQFLSFNGDKTLLRKTFERIKSEIPVERIFVITLPDYTDEVKNFLTEIPHSQIIVEPARRDTLLAAGLGAVIIKQRDPDAIIANLWSDQLIEGVESYRDSLFAAAKTAWETKALVTTGVRPEYPHPGLEYVRKGRFFNDTRDTRVYKVDKFIERPERSGQDVEEVYKDKHSLWHIGLWVWKADVYLEKVRDHAKETYGSLLLIEKHLKENDSKEKIERVYKAAPKVQIDMVISKDQTDMYVVEGEFDWLDLGDFNVLWRIGKKDRDHNSSLLKDGSEWLNIDTSGSYVLSTGKKIVVTAGLKDIVVIAMDDAVLVLPRSESQKVKEVVAMLKDKGKKEYL